MILNIKSKNMKETVIFAMKRKRGIQICHFEGLRQNSVFAGDQMGDQAGGGVSGSGGSVNKPISE